MFLDDSGTEGDGKEKGKKEQKFRDIRLDSAKGPDLTQKYREHIVEVTKAYGEAGKSLAIDELGKRHGLREKLAPIGESHSVLGNPANLESGKEDMLKEALRKSQVEDIFAEKTKDSSSGMFRKHIEKLKAVYTQYSGQLFSGFGSRSKSNSRNRLKYYRSEK